jgi:hypothetical protein
MMVPIVIPLSVLSLIPASALKGIPRTGSVADLLDALLTREVRRGIKAYTQQQTAQRKAQK